VSQAFARKVEAEGVTVAEWVFLRALFDQDGVSPSQLAERMGMTKSAISKLADRLIEKELVKKGASTVDRRGQTLALQASAKRLVPRLANLADENDEEFFGGLSRSERSQLMKMLRKIAVDRDLKSTPVT
jgi:DNA-binding MarR family transcriptional regulator